MPDDFEPDDFEADDFESDNNPSWLDRIWTSPTEEARQTGRRNVTSRPDTSWFGGYEPFFEDIRRGLSNKIGMSPMIPQALKKPLNIALDLPLVELPQTIADMLSTPEVIASPALLRGKVPEVKFPIEEPPTPKLKPKALPPGRDPYIGGPGGLQRQSLLTPQEEARLAGHEFIIDENGDIVPAGYSTPRTGTILETERPPKPFYTAHEQQGGTALEIPESDRYLRGNELGFDAVSQGPLEYPLNVVPESVRPRFSQEVTRSLSREAPAEMTEAEKFTFENEQVPPKAPEPLPREGTRLGTDILLPPAIKQARQARTNTGLNIDEATVARVPEPLQAPIQAMIETESKLPSPWKTVYTQLEQLSPTLAVKAKRAVQITRQYDAQWIPDFEHAINKLSTQQKTNFGSYVEGTLPITDVKVQKAVDIWRTVENAIGDKATDSGLRLFTDSKKWIPFIKNTENYWPHIPTEKQGTGIIQKLVDSGMSRSEAKRVEGYYRKNGELIVGAQHAREVKSNIPYRMDADAGLQHIRSMSKRIAQHEEFGPMDVKGKGAEGISDLIEATKDPNLASKLMERIIGRDERSNATLNKWLDRSRKFAALAHLQNFTLPNMILGQGTTALKSSRYPIASMKEVLNLFSKRYRGEMARSGVWQNFNHTLAEEMSRFDPYMIGPGETFNRGIAGAVGKAVAREALKELRRNPASKAARQELSNLVLEDVDQVVRQNELTSKQLDMAAGRMAEVTQGLNVPGNLPFDWSNPVSNIPNFAAQLMLQFKKMGYQATKNVWDSIDPRKVGVAQSAKNVALWIGISQVVGELTGDIKAGARGLWTGNPDERVRDRGDWWLNSNGISSDMIDGVASNAGVPPEMIARMLDNASQSFMLGLPADLIMSSTYGPASLLSALSGPVISDAAKLFYYSLTGNFRGLGKEAIKMAPVPGSSGLSESIFTED